MKVDEMLLGIAKCGSVNESIGVRQLHEMVKAAGIKGLSRAPKEELRNRLLQEAVRVCESKVGLVEDNTNIVTHKAAILKTFTGMLIGKIKEDGSPFTYEIKEKSDRYELTKLNGEVLSFDKDSLKQIGAKNPKFANKIETVEVEER